MRRKDQNSGHKKPEYIKPQIVVSYTKDELKEEFKELQGLSAFVDLFGFNDSPEMKIYDSLDPEKTYTV